MITFDQYIARLEKRAADDSAIPPNDSAEATNAEFNKNQEDNKQYLTSTFSRAGAVASDMSATKKLFSGHDGTTVVGHPLMKTAFFQQLGQLPILKTASPLHLEVIFSAFTDELSKIAAAHNR